MVQTFPIFMTKTVDNKIITGKFSRMNLWTCYIAFSSLPASPSPVDKNSFAMLQALKKTLLRNRHRLDYLPFLNDLSGKEWIVLETFRQEYKLHLLGLQNMISWQHRTERDRQTDRPTDRETDRGTDRQRDRDLCSDCFCLYPNHIKDLPLCVNNKISLIIQFHSIRKCIQPTHQHTLTQTNHQSVQSTAAIHNTQWRSHLAISERKDATGITTHIYAHVAKTTKAVTTLKNSPRPQRR